jgi:hypothetical protein
MVQNMHSLQLLLDKIVRAWLKETRHQGPLQQSKWKIADILFLFSFSPSSTTQPGHGHPRLSS